MKEVIHKPQESRVLQPKPGKNQPPLEQILATYYKPLQRTSAVIQRNGGDIESGAGEGPYGAPNLNSQVYLAPHIKGFKESIKQGEPTGRTILDGMLLNHYMVVRNGTQYQLPIRAVIDPYGGTRHERALRVEPFGGNQGWNDYKRNIESVLDHDALKMSRNRTLGHEYFEEAGEPLNATPTEGVDPYTTVDDAHVSKSVYFRIPKTERWRAQGTISIVDSVKALTSKPNLNLRNPKSDSAKREMAGTIVIETNDIRGNFNEIEQQIKDRIVAAQAEFIKAYYPKTTFTEEDFGKGSEILLMSVKLMAQQVLERNLLETIRYIRKDGRSRQDQQFDIMLLLGAHNKI